MFIPFSKFFGNKYRSLLSIVTAERLFLFLRSYLLSNYKSREVPPVISGLFKDHLQHAVTKSQNPECQGLEGT